MIELIAKILLIGSILGMGVILFRKIPILLDMPVKVQKSEELFFPSLINKIKSFRFVKNISLENILQKILSRIKILTLKIENKISDWLQNLRKRSQKKKEKQGKNDNYWEELKKSTNQKDKGLPM